MTERIAIDIPVGMKDYIQPSDSLRRNALWLYLSIMDRKISHGKAAEIIGIRKLDLIDLYASMGLPYLDQTMDELEEDMSTLRDLFGSEGKA